MNTHSALVSYEQLLMLRRMAQSPHPSAYITAVRIALTGALNPEALHRSLDVLAVRHHALRTRFVAAPDGGWSQAVDAPRPVRYAEHDFTALAPDGREAGIRTLVEDFTERPFDIAEGHLLRTALVRTGQDRWELLLAYHHLIVDGWALRILLEDLSALYVAEAGGPAPATVRSQPADHARAQREDVDGEQRVSALRHWLDLLGDRSQLLDLPADFPRPAGFIGRGEAHVFALGREPHDGVRRLAGQCGVTPFVVLASAVAVLMSRLTGRGDIVLSVPFFNRTAEYERVVTCMAGPLLLVCEVRPGDSFTDLVERTGDRFFTALEHSGVPFTDLLDALVAERGWTSQDPPTVAVAMQNFGLDDALTLPGVSAATHFESLRVAYTDLVLNLTDTGEGVDGVAVYRSELLRAETVADWTRELTALVADLVTEPGVPFTVEPFVRG
ncbi:condensation domain-containing protein [Streptomyces sp. NBC_01429]|uniref:condensation domain-containing protein n=1 Tax=Streptomyces sp. NBC_01429 TaxID=2903862 RepID=UPI002E2B943F|nr:condensation domain-containing protein [Streptomyces sp. NBC_01429]